MSTHYSHTFPQQQQLQLVQGKPHRLVLGTSTQIRDEVSTGEVSHSFRARPTPTHSCSVSLTSTKMSSQLTHRDCKSLFSTLTKKYDCLEGSNGFNLWQMQTKEHVMVYLRPSAVCYIHNSLQRPDWGSFSCFSSGGVQNFSVNTALLLSLGCKFAAERNYKTELAFNSPFVQYLHCPKKTRRTNKYLGSPTGRLTWYGAIQELSRMPGSSSHRIPTALQRT